MSFKKPMSSLKGGLAGYVGSLYPGVSLLQVSKETFSRCAKNNIYQKMGLKIKGISVVLVLINTCHCHICTRLKSAKIVCGVVVQNGGRWLGLAKPVA